MGVNHSHNQAPQQENSQPEWKKTGRSEGKQLDFLDFTDGTSELLAAITCYSSRNGGKDSKVI